ncbi:hypothetical protein SAMN05444955_11745 [Lihuaxuella thermophila]|uniref:Uncharacterized protein n=1 Tax=Lihuaxuella thermophila TaxID=1173111 RepID=A0A1H8IEW0_9BACL|nr:hypothetical protein SAMN05444955_11745 [Lihuaxuella thermophila]
MNGKPEDKEPAVAFPSFRAEADRRFSLPRCGFLPSPPWSSNWPEKEIYLLCNYLIFIIMNRFFEPIASRYLSS